MIKPRSGDLVFLCGIPQTKEEQGEKWAINKRINQPSINKVKNEGSPGDQLLFCFRFGKFIFLLLFVARSTRILDQFNIFQNLFTQRPSRLIHNHII
jgi:hypothetical protein